MSLTPGTRLGPYEITGALGAGGMGEVFRARDTKLNRDVAIKVLPAAFADDPERLARFTREAQTLASLNHPNIAAIYGLENLGAPLRLRCGSGRAAGPGLARAQWRRSGSGCSRHRDHELDVAPGGIQTASSPKSAPPDGNYDVPV